MIYGLSAAIIVFALINAYIAKRKGYFFWRTFFFSLILGIAVISIFVLKSGLL